MDIPVDVLADLDLADGSARGDRVDPVEVPHHPEGHPVHVAPHRLDAHLTIHVVFGDLKPR